MVGDRRPEDGGSYSTGRIATRTRVRTQFGFVAIPVHERTVQPDSVVQDPKSPSAVAKSNNYPHLPYVESEVLRCSTRFRGQSMLLTIGKFAIVAALAFAGGVLLGRHHPAPSAKQKQLEKALKQFQHAFGDDTATPVPICDQPSDDDKRIISGGLDDPTAGPWAKTDDFDAMYIAVVTSKSKTPALFSHKVNDPTIFLAVNATARKIAPSLATGEPSEVGNEAIDCVTP